MLYYLQDDTATYQPVSTYAYIGVAGTPGQTVGYTRLNDDYISIEHASFGCTGYQLSGDVQLESEPTWAAANMEASTQADIYIEPASATKSGLVNTSAQSFAGLKDFTEGVDVASVAGSFYEEGTETYSIRQYGGIVLLLSTSR